MRFLLRENGLVTIYVNIMVIFFEGVYGTIRVTTNEMSVYLKNVRGVHVFFFMTKW